MDYVIDVWDLKIAFKPFVFKCIYAQYTVVPTRKKLEWKA